MKIYITEQEVCENILYINSTQYVLSQKNDRPNRAKKPYWKASKPSIKGWQKYYFNGRKISLEKTHHRPILKKYRLTRFYYLFIPQYWSKYGFKNT